MSDVAFSTPAVSSTHQAVYQHNGWIVSPYSQKTLAYLKYKGIPHRNHAPNGYQLMRSIPKHVGKAVMPTVQTPDGQWLQDSADIIDYFEQHYPQHSIQPHTPKQQLVAHLLELHGDEWLVLPALHYRWSDARNRDFIVGEFGRYALPGMPGFIRKLAGNRIGDMMMRYLPRFGIVGETENGVRRYTEQLITLLEEHFKLYKYFLGNRPCVGDFAFFGPLFAHLYRDPGSTFLFADSPNLVQWIQCLLTSDGSAAAEDDHPQQRFLPDDEIPHTLVPILQLIFAEQLPFCSSVIDAINRYVDEHPQATRVPRIIGDGEFVIGGVKGQRKQFSFIQWKVQRCLAVYQQLTAAEKPDVDQWLQDIGGDALTRLHIKHPLKRENFKEVLA